MIIEISAKDKQEAIFRLEKERSLDRMLLEQKIANLNKAVEMKEMELSTTKYSLAESTVKQRELEMARRKLISAVDQLDKKTKSTKIFSFPLYSQNAKTIKRKSKF